MNMDEIRQVLLARKNELQWADTKIARNAGFTVITKTPRGKDRFNAGVVVNFFAGRKTRLEDVIRIAKALNYRLELVREK